MVIKTASPGVIINEVDLTRGTSDAITTNVGGMVGPFARGPVDELVLIETEAELQRVFGDPTTENCEYWYTVSNFLEYGGVCYVIRCDDASGGNQQMKNAVSNGSPVFIKNKDDFEENFDDGISLSAYFAATTPGKYGNAFGVAVIDAGADQQLRLGTSIIKDAAGAAVASTTRPATGAPGNAAEPVEALLVSAFVAPTPFLEVATAAFANITLSGEQAIGGVSTNVSRVLVAGQDDASENGIYVSASGAWNRAGDADEASDFEFAKSVTVPNASSNAGVYYYQGQDDLGGADIGTVAINFSSNNPAPSALSVFDFVKLANPQGAGAATGYVSRLDTTTVAGKTVVYISIASGTFVGALSATSALANAADAEVSGTIEFAESVTAISQYDAVNPNTDTTFNVILSNATYTVDQGSNLFGWSTKPTPGSNDISSAGVHYSYSGDLGVWVADYKLAIGDVFGAIGTTAGTPDFYQLVSAESWYNQQVAFEGIPWFRFAPRPGTSLNALARGAKNDELNIIIYDATGDETNSKGNLLEAYYGVSKLKGALTPEGEANYYHKVINERSGFVYAGATLPEVTGGTINDGNSAVGTQIANGVVADYIPAANYLLTGGVDQLQATLGERQIAYNKFSTENVSDLDYLLQGPSGTSEAESTAIGNFLINIVEERRDCMCFLSPPRFKVVGLDSETVTHNIEEWADTLTSSSYAVFDSGYKYAFDRFNDVYRYLPLNGDVAGTLVFTAIEAEPYYSPAGISRGQIRNVVKLAYNPSKPQRDILYAARVNPVVTFPGEGTVLFGDKTGLAYSSAFDRINVRRLFLVVEKEIAEIARVNLFEFNDQVTRTLFKNNVNPFLRDIQSKRGMFDFLVVCDETNNPPAIIDRNEFVADIYIKPARSINFITLNFVATKTGATFEESIGSFRGTTSTTGV